MYHIYYDSNAEELFHYVVATVEHRTVHFHWARSIAGLKVPAWTEVQPSVVCRSLKEFLSYHVEYSGAKFTRILSFKSFADLPSLLPEHFI